MSLLIDLFNNSKIQKQVNRRISYIKHSDYKLSSKINRDDLIKYCLDFTNDFDFVGKIQYCLDNPRNCFNLLGSDIDTHFDLETLNVSSRARDYVVIYSIESLLPLILNICCEVDSLLFKELDGIDRISKSILELDFSEDCLLGPIMGIDVKLDGFLDKFFSSSCDEVECLSSIVSVLNSTAMEVLKYIVCYLETYSPMVILATDKSKIVLSSSIDKVESLEIVFGGYKYILEPFVTDDIFGYYHNSANFNYLTGYSKCKPEVSVL